MIIFLQNAWSPVYAGTVWPRRSWLRALAQSPAGRRLRILTDDLACVHNVAPLCGLSPSSVMPAEDKHVIAILESCTPRVVVACGKHAQAALVRLWDGPLLLVPHPTHRVLTNELYRRVRAVLDLPEFTGRIVFTQQRGGITVESYK